MGSPCDRAAAATRALPDSWALLAPLRAADSPHMNLRALALAGLCGAALFSGAYAPATAAINPQQVKSESYYDVDASTGVMSVHADLTIQNATQKDLKALIVWAMPGATDIVVTLGDATLTTTVTPSQDARGIPTSVSVALPRPLKPRARVSLKLSYTVPPRNSVLLRSQPGAVEALLVSQGAGSFVFVDVPSNGENYFDPGCLKVLAQPTEVKDRGKERWVCGEATIIALSSDNPDVLKDCSQLDDRCRQRLLDTPLSAFMQSITDQSSRGSLEAEVALGDRSVKMVFRYFKQDEAWATREFAVAQKAFPLLEQLFGYPYPFETITLRQSHHIEIIGAAGVAFSRIGEVLLAPDTGFDDEVTTHELAHQWAGNQLAKPWIWEGLSEYAQHTLAPTLGYRPIDRGWERKGYTDPLATWYDGSGIYDANYWYGKAGAFWAAYATAVGGPENMTKVLAQVDDDPGQWPLDVRWFMDRGERVSGANLDELFLTWVFNPVTSVGLLKERRAAWDSVKTLTDRAATLGLTGVPSDIVANLDAWAFKNLASQVAAANKVLDAYTAVTTLAAQAGYPAPAAVADSWGTSSVSATAGVVETQRQALQALIAAAADLESQPPESPAWAEWTGAREAYAAGDFAEAARLAAASTTNVVNQATSARLIARAHDLQSRFQPTWLEKIGMAFSDPKGDLAKAEAAYGNGQYEAALDDARGAINAWEGAETRGMQRLAFIFGLTGLAAFFVWWLLRRLDPAPPLPARGHVLAPPEERKAGWRDWENTP